MGWPYKAILVAGCAAPVAFTGAVLASTSGGENGIVSRMHTRPPDSISSRTSPPSKAVDRVRNATPQPTWRRHTGPVPILEYHELGTPPASEPYPELYVSDTTFEAQMGWLHRRGYQAVTMDEVMAAWYHHGRLPPKPVVITFDNGYVPQATFAPHVLSRYGWPGVLNEITANHLADWRLRRLIALGWEVDSHSVTHPNLATLDPHALRYQVDDSRRFLRRTFGIPVDSFCYPSNDYDAAVVAAVRAAGYTNALTENPGFASRRDPFLLDRYEITGGVTQLSHDLSER